MPIMRKITLGFTIVGALEEAKVYANGVPIQCFAIGSGKYTGGFTDALIKSGSTLEIQFHLFATNGTAYEIEYSFLDEGNEEKDSTNPSPIKKSITSNNNKVEKVKFTA